MKQQEFLLENYSSFNLRDIFECGQCFRWNKEEDGSYTGVFANNVINVSKTTKGIYFKGVCEKDIVNTVIDYFDLDRDYNEIKRTLAKVDNNMKESIRYGEGIRILNQDLWETIISFIISANNNIPRISKSIDEISKRYGTEINFEGEAYYLFPTVNQLSNVTKDEFRKCGVGFRDKYLFDTVSDIKNGKFDICNFKEISTEKLRKKRLILGVFFACIECESPIPNSNKKRRAQKKTRRAQKKRGRMENKFWAMMLLENLIPSLKLRIDLLGPWHSDFLAHRHCAL